MARNIVGISRSFGRGENHMQLLRSGLALYLVISPDDDVMRMLQVRVFLHLSINLRDVSTNSFRLDCCFNLHTHTHTHICRCACTQRMHAGTYASTHKHIHTCTCMHALTHMHTHTQTDTHALMQRTHTHAQRTHTHAHTHTCSYTHTHTHIPSPLCHRLPSVVKQTYSQTKHNNSKPCNAWLMD